MTHTTTSDAELASLRAALMRYQRQTRRVARACPVSLAASNDNALFTLLNCLHEKASGSERASVQSQTRR